MRIVVIWALVTPAFERDDGGPNPLLKGGRHVFRITVGLRRSAPLARDAVRISIRAGRRGTKGLRYPPDPPTVEEIIAVMRAAGDRPDGLRLRGVIVVLWRAGLRISEALALAESDLDRTRGAVLVRRGKGGKRREVGMDRCAWEQLDPWLADPGAGLLVGALFCVLRRPTRGHIAFPPGSRTLLRNAAVAAGVRRRFAPHQLRHAHAMEMGREGVPLVVIQRQLGHADLGITSSYPRGIENRNHPRRPRTTSTDDPGHHRLEPRGLSGPTSLTH